MNCVKCGFEVPDGGTFCPNCGARADGKKKCINCKSLINETAVYCTFCGARVDGKKVCDVCGEVFEGKFCPKCGRKFFTEENEKQRGKDTENKYDKVIKKINPCLFLVVFISLFVCSFFIGFSSEVVLTSNFSTTTNAFYFFSKSFESTKITLSEYILSANYNQALNVYNVRNVICLLAIIANFIVQLVCLIWGVVKAVKSLAGNYQKGCYKLAAWSFVSFLTTVLIVSIFYNFSVYQNDYRSSTTITTGSLIGIIISSVALITAIVLAQIRRLNVVGINKQIKKLIPISCVFLFALGALIAVGTGVFNIFMKTIEEGVVTDIGEGRITTGCFTINMITTGLYGTASSQLNDVVGLSQTLTYFNVATILLLAWAVYNAINPFFSRRDNAKSVLTASIAAFVTVLAYFILSVATRQEILSTATEEVTSEAIKVGAGVIIALIFSTLSLISTIVYYASLHKQN